MPGRSPVPTASLSGHWLSPLPGQLLRPHPRPAPSPKARWASQAGCRHPGGRNRAPGHGHSPGNGPPPQSCSRPSLQGCA